MLMIAPAYAAELSVEYEVIARTGETPVPDGSGVFLGFGAPPVIDDNGNVAFVGGGQSEVGLYTFAGVCCDKVMDNHTPIPGGGGATFAGFYQDDNYDIDDGRVAFEVTHNNYPSVVGVYSNAGQANPTDLAEVALIDGCEWSTGGEPWLDGTAVAMSGRRLIPNDHHTILSWNGANQSSSFVNAGAGYIFGAMEASISGDAAIFGRYNPTTESAELAVLRDDGGYDVLVVYNSTAIPGLGGAAFSNIYAHPQVGRDGQDAVFLGYGNQTQVLVKRVDGGPLQNVVDTTTEMPNAGGERFKSLEFSGYSLANGQVAFNGYGEWGRDGIYTDVGGELSVLVDNQDNNIIDLDGVAEQILNIHNGPKSFASTPQGYMVVFKADLLGGDSAIIRATINGTPGGGTGSFTVYKDFSDNNSASVNVHLSCSSGTVSNSPQQAREGVPAVFTITGASAGTTCTASEPSVPAGYTRNQTDCQNGDPLNGSCTIANTLAPAESDFWVFVNFSDNAKRNVGVSLNCSSGTVTNSPQSASEAAPAVFDIEGFFPGTSCTATENSVPSGYTVNESECRNVPLQETGGCEIFNVKAQQSEDVLFSGGFEID